MHTEFCCGNPKQNRTIFRPRLSLKNGIKTDLKEHYRRYVSGLSGSAMEHTTVILNTVMNAWVTKDAGIF